MRARGPSPNSNAAHAQLLTAAKRSRVPKGIINRNIKKASEKGQADYTEIVYEVIYRSLLPAGRPHRLLTLERDVGGGGGG